MGFSKTPLCIVLSGSQQDTDCLGGTPILRPENSAEPINLIEATKCTSIAQKGLNLHGETGQSKVSKYFGAREREDNCQTQSII